MYELTGSIQAYDWGTTDRIPAILGTPDTGQPQAEYWLGAHASAPSLMDSTDLATHLRDHPGQLGDRSRKRFGDVLPYLMKILSAGRPLSLQAHPTREQAEAGFARENEAGVPITARERVYRDDWPKPEMLVALTPFDALCGFRDPEETASFLEQLGASSLQRIIAPLRQRGGAAGLAEAFFIALGLDDQRSLLPDLLTAALEHANDEGPAGDLARTAIMLDGYFRGDRTILAALLLNRIHLEPGEWISLPAGNMHAYLSGTGIEIMANSDNVVRGGLTTKHIDPDELISVVDFTPMIPPNNQPAPDAPGVHRYDFDVAEFSLYRASVNESGPIELPESESGRIVLVTDGKIVLDSEDASLEMHQGRAAFVEAGAEVTATGNGICFLAAPGR